MLDKVTEPSGWHVSAGGFIIARERILLPISFSLTRRKPGLLARLHERLIGGQVLRLLGARY